jgi:flagellar biosynthetic protein FliR
MTLNGSYWETLLLVVVRVASLFMVAPFFSMRTVPAMFKVGLAVFISLLVFEQIPPRQYVHGVLEQSVYLYLMDMVKESLVGLLIGFVAYMLISATMVAGQIMDIQVGFSLSNVLDPQSGIPSPLIGNFQYLLAMLLFMGSNAHYALLAAVMQSYQFVPIAGAALTGPVMQLLLNTFLAMFLLGLKIAMPVIATLFLSDIIMAFMSRVAPQMNIFAVGLPVKLLLGLLVLLATLPVLIELLQQVFQAMFVDMDQMLRALEGKP